MVLITCISIFSNILFAQNTLNHKSLYQIYQEADKAYDRQDYEKAFKLFSKYIDETKKDSFSRISGISLYIGESYYQIGHFYLCGHYVKANIDTAINNLEIACLNYKYSRAARLLSHIYLFKQYNHVNLELSFHYLEMAANLGNINSNIELGQIYLSGSSKCMKDTTIYTYHYRIDNKGDTIKSRCFRKGMTPTSTILKYPMVKTDSIKGYRYYERGKDINWSLYGADYSLTELDFARAYMDGTYCSQDFERAWEYLKELDPISIQNSLEKYGEQYDYEKDTDAGEILWRMQTCYRFGLGTKVNIKKADIYLKKSAELGYQKAVNAIKFQ